MKLPFLLLNLKLLILLFTLLHTILGLAVMSIDLGSEWMKVAIVSPGVPMEIALNTESQRKTPTVISFRDGERLFGDAAASIGVRFPEKSFKYVLEVLGKTIDNPLVQLYKEKFPYYKLKSDDKSSSIVFVHPEGLELTAEEIIAMLLSHAQNIAQNAAGQVIKDAVITVPAYFNQAERRALLKAAELAGITVLQLINGNTAVALNYGVFRRKDFNETPNNILFYDMGASSTVASIVSYQLVKTKDKVYTETNPQLAVKGVGFDRTLGGLQMQFRLRDHLAKTFNGQKKTSSDVFKNHRSMAKLFKEAGRVKKVLSANTDHVAQVESLLDDKDFKASITRQEFEDMCEDLFERVVKPVDMAIKSAGITMDEIDQVILAGSGSRIPKVQQKLLEYVKKSELGKSVNTDEAAALGAAYQAAYLSKGFKVKTFAIKDANIYPIQVDFQREVEQEDGKLSTKFTRRTLFSRNNPYPQKKVLTFNRHIKDFEFFVNYGDVNFLMELDTLGLGALNLSKVSVSGVEAALTKHASNAEAKGIKAHFRMDESGILRIEDIESVFEKKSDDTDDQPDLESTLAKLGNTIGRLFSGSSDDSTTEDSVSKEEPNYTTDTEESKSQKTQSDEQQKTSENKTEDTGEKKIVQENETSTTNDSKADKKGPKIIPVKESLLAEKVFVDFMDLSSQETTQLIKKLLDLDEKDRKKLDIEKSKNSLESFILETKEKLYMTEYEQASTESERETIVQKLNEVGEWLEYNSDGATAEQFKENLQNLRSLTRSLFERVREHRDRPESLNALKEMLNISSTFLNNARAISATDQIFTEVELNTLEKLINDTSKWKAQSEKEQQTTALSETPKLTIKSIAEKIAALDREVKYLLNKVRITPPKKKEDKEDNATVSRDASSEATNETQTESEQADSEKTIEEEPSTIKGSDAESKSEKSSEGPSEKLEQSSHSEL